MSDTPHSQPPYVPDTLFLVTDCPFNKTYSLKLIGHKFVVPPSHTAVKKVPGVHGDVFYRNYSHFYGETVDRAF